MTLTWLVGCALRVCLRSGSDDTPVSWTPEPHHPLHLPRREPSASRLCVPYVEEHPALGRRWWVFAE